MNTYLIIDRLGCQQDTIVAPTPHQAIAIYLGFDPTSLGLCANLTAVNITELEEFIQNISKLK